MEYINYNKISYVMSEKADIFGMLAFELISKIIHSNDMLKFILYNHGIHNYDLESFLLNHNDATILPSNNKIAFIIKNIELNSKTLDLFCSLGKYPNYIEILKINDNLELKDNYFEWKIEYSDDMLTILYLDNHIDDLTFVLIDKELSKKDIYYKRKKMVKVKYKVKSNKTNYLL